jgi:hypothetical protein
MVRRRRRGEGASVASRHEFPPDEKRPLSTVKQTLIAGVSALYVSRLGERRNPALVRLWADSSAERGFAHSIFRARPSKLR